MSTPIMRGESGSAGRFPDRGLDIRLEIASRNFSTDAEVDLSRLTHRDVDGETRDP